MKFIPLSVPNVSGNEMKYVNEALADGWISSAGSYVTKFESALADYTTQPDAVAVSSGTAGLHLAFLDSGVRANDLVLAPSLTFIASINPIRYCNADPIFVDIDESLCIDPLKLALFLKQQCHVKDGQTFHNQSGRVIRAIVVVHIFGNMADMEQLMEVLEQYPMMVIEDAAEALGTTYTSGRYATRMAGTIGDFGVYSFNGNKIISSGGGGCVVSNVPNSLQHIRYLSTQAKDDALYFVHNEVGYNYRLTNIQAAVGCGQMEQLESFIVHKQTLYALYQQLFQQANIVLLPFRDNIRSNHWFFSILWEEEFGCTRDAFMAELKQQGIEVRPLWALIHEQVPYVSCLKDDLSCSLYYKTRVVNIPCSTNLSLEDATHVAKAIIRIKEGKQG